MTWLPLAAPVATTVISGIAGYICGRILRARDRRKLERQISDLRQGAVYHYSVTSVPGPTIKEELDETRLNLAALTGKHQATTEQLSEQTLAASRYLLRSMDLEESLERVIATLKPLAVLPADPDSQTAFICLPSRLHADAARVVAFAEAILRNTKKES